jgi:flagellar motor protein MotB
MIRRRGDEGIGANPFVVLVDITIAVAFILAVYAMNSTLGSSQSLLQMTRQERQKQIRDQLVSALTGVFPNATAEPFDPNLRIQVVDDEQRNRVAEIFENASYQRVSILVPMFQSGTALPNPRALTIWHALGDVVARNWRQLDYLQLHGIVDAAETDSPESALELSRHRADASLRRLQKEGIVARTDQEPTGVPLKYVVAFGTGSELYANLRNNNRVDLVLFFPDNR